MFRTVELPLWLLILILAFAAVTFASHFLFPSVRWFFRRRMERAVAELNKRLARPIQPFKLARRHDRIQRLIYDHQVLEAVAEQARTAGIPEAVAHERALHYAREIVPGFSATIYFGLAIRLARRVARAFYEVRIATDPALERIDPAATVVFVMNHRSNMDYILVTYLVAERTTLSYAVGEWARVWPLQSLIRAMGAFFVRRRPPGALYRIVLARYVAMATAAGVTQAVFPEGGLSLDGRLQPPRSGILSYILAGAEPGGRDVVFVPVALNYDRVIEDRVLIEARRTGERRFRAPVPTILGFTARHLWQRLRGRFPGYGAAAVAFGAPLSLAAFRRDDPAASTETLAEELMARIARAIPVLPVPLVAKALLEAPGPVSRAAIAEQALRFPALASPGAAARAVDEGVARLTQRGLATETAGGVIARSGARDELAFYAASITHLADATAAEAVPGKSVAT